MATLLRQAVLLAVAAALTWWIVFFDSRPSAAPREVSLEELQVAVALAARAAEQAPAEDTPPLSAAAEPVEASVAEEPAAEEPAEEPAEVAPAPPELGDPDGDPEGAPPVSAAPLESEDLESDDEVPSESTPAAEPPSEAIDRSAAALMRDTELLEAAREEIDGEVRRGFATVLLAAPEDQIDIARAFGEELVLVPKAALDPDAERPQWFRLDVHGTPRIESVVGKPELERYRQYRDLFEYEYARLPGPLRELRRSVLARSEIYLFAALIPSAEWAVVIGRRRAALETSGREPADVRRYVLRTVRTKDGAFDVRVEEIVFSDGTRFQPTDYRRQP